MTKLANLRPFPKGKSGNPGGRPRELRDVQELARAATAEAMAALVEVMKNKKASPSARVAAAQAILDRGWGKPNQPVDLNVSFLDKLSDDEQRALLNAIQAMKLDPTPTTVQ